MIREFEGERRRMRLFILSHVTRVSLSVTLPLCQCNLEGVEEKQCLRVMSILCRPGQAPSSKHKLMKDEFAPFSSYESQNIA